MVLTKEYGEFFTRLVNLIRAASSVYSQDVGYVRALDRELAEASRQVSGELLGLLNRLLRISAKENAPQLESVDDLIARWSSLEVVFDSLIDRLDLGTVERNNSKTLLQSGQPSKIQSRDKILEKPQERFDAPIDNSLGPFKPLLTQKPHATSLGLAESLKGNPADPKHAGLWFSQPYATEIKLSHYPTSLNDPGIRVPFPKTMATTPLNWVDSPHKLRKMISKLRKATALAVDLEHHDYRTYLGLLCLMQISTTNEDWLIDTLALRTELQALNDIFCDPNVVKVFHGAHHDIQWLQRDLGVYVVGLVDTYHAACSLGLSRHSLAFLLENYANYTPNKQYQLADWRIRPLGQELIEYARADTHFLLYVWDQLRHELLERNLLEDVLASSRKTAAQRYEKPGYNLREPAWLPLALKHRIISRVDQAVLARIYDWRDQVARQKDESPRYVMPNHMLISIAAVKPHTVAQLLGLTHQITSYVRDAATTIVELVIEAEADPLSAFTVEDKSCADVNSPSVLEAAKALRLSTPRLFANSIPTMVSSPPVFLGLIKLDDLGQLNTARNEASMSTPGISGSGSESESGSESGSESESDNSRTEEQQEDGDQKLETRHFPDRKSNGRRVNIVDKVPNIPNAAQSLQKKKRKAEFCAPFDFDQAAPVLQASSHTANVRDGNKKGRFGEGPRPGPGARRGRSRTFR